MKLLKPIDKAIVKDSRRCRHALTQDDSESDREKRRSSRRGEAFVQDVEPRCQFPEGRARSEPACPTSGSHRASSVSILG